MDNFIQVKERWPVIIVVESADDYWLIDITTHEGNCHKVTNIG